MTLFGRLIRSFALLASLALASTGCGLWPLDSSSGTADDFSAAGLVLGSSSELPEEAAAVTELEPNDSFANAQEILFAETARIAGTIEPDAGIYDRDVFDLGVALENDRVLADLEVDEGVDVVVGILDDRQRLLGYLDLSSYSTGPRQIDFVVHEQTNRLYAVAATRSTSSKARDYVIRISVQRKLGDLVDHPQVLVLNFEGARQVQVGNRPPVNVPAFDAKTISRDFEDHTQAIADLVFEKVKADFAGLDVSVYRSTDPTIPRGDHSTVYFGTYDSRLLGLADGVDPYNLVPVQSAILYTDTFAIFNSLKPGVEQIAQALANTASHEAGHLLGLRHTADPTDLMDTTATARQMLLDQDFSLAKLNSSVLPIGMQDGPSLLAWAVGGELLYQAGKELPRQRALEAAGQPDDFYIPREWLMDCPCDQCTHP